MDLKKKLKETCHRGQQNSTLPLLVSKECRII